MDYQSFLAALQQWAQKESALWGLLLVGSYARGTATAASDIDLILFTESPDIYLGDMTWIDYFGTIHSKNAEDWGLLQSVRVFFAGGPEVEFGITSSRWLALPLDEGTRQVLMDGYRILYDPEGKLAQLRIVLS